MRYTEFHQRFADGPCRVNRAGIRYRTESSQTKYNQKWWLANSHTTQSTHTICSFKQNQTQSMGFFVFTVRLCPLMKYSVLLQMVYVTMDCVRAVVIHFPSFTCTAWKAISGAGVKNARHSQTALKDMPYSCAGWLSPADLNSIFGVIHWWCSCCSGALRCLFNTTPIDRWCCPGASASSRTLICFFFFFNFLFHLAAASVYLLFYAHRPS